MSILVSSNPISSSGFLAQSSFESNVEKILDFLAADDSYMKKVTENELKANKIIVETINAFVVVVSSYYLLHCVILIQAVTSTRVHLLPLYKYRFSQ